MTLARVDVDGPLVVTWPDPAGDIRNVPAHKVVRILDDSRPLQIVQLPAGLDLRKRTNGTWARYRGGGRYGARAYSQSFRQAAALLADLRLHAEQWIEDNLGGREKPERQGTGAQADDVSALPGERSEVQP